MNRFFSLKDLAKNIRNNHIIAVSVGIIYLWFGLLKFFEHTSPAEDLAVNTMQALSGEYFSSSFLLLSLAIMEVVIGASLLLNIYQNTIIKVALFHMLFTFTPLFLFANESFAEPPYALTLTGQYIMKNLVVIAALFTLYKRNVRRILREQSVHHEL